MGSAMHEAADGRNIFVVAGGGLAAAFAEAGLLDRIVVAVVPVLLGGGKPLYAGRLDSSRLVLSNVERVGQVANLTYDVRTAAG
jgi:dihydrofolate reductase